MLFLFFYLCKPLCPFQIPASTLSKCRVLHEDPVTFEELNSQSGESNQGYTNHIDSCIQGLLKESREKFRGWVSIPVHIDVDVSYKKVGDGHPLRLWKCTVDVEAPPTEVLNRVLHDRYVSCTLNIEEFHVLIVFWITVTSTVISDWCGEI